MASRIDLALEILRKICAIFNDPVREDDARASGTAQCWGRWGNVSYRPDLFRTGRFILSRSVL